MTTTIEDRLQNYRIALDEAADGLDVRPRLVEANGENIVPMSPTSPSRRRRLAVGLAAAGLVGAAVGVIAWRVSPDESEPPATQTEVTTPPPTRAPATTPPPTAPAVGLDAYYLLGDLPISGFYELPARGTRQEIREVRFGPDDETTDSHDVFWRDGDTESWREEADMSGDLVATIDVFGADAQVFRYRHGSGQPRGTNDFTAIWRSGESTMEFRVNQTIRTEFEALLGQLRQVDQAEFDAALEDAGLLPDATSTSASTDPGQNLAPLGMDRYFLLADAEVTYYEFDEPSRLLADDPGHREMQFALDGGHAAKLHWRDPNIDSWIADRAASAELIATPSMFDSDVQVFDYGGGDEFTALWPSGDTTMEFRASAPSAADFEALLGQLRIVDRADFEAALPEGSLDTPDPTVIDDILSDVPVVPDKMYEQFAGDGDRLTVADTVVSAVICDWVDFYVPGATGNMFMARTALAEADGWAILRELGAAGSDLPAKVRTLADVARAELEGGQPAISPRHAAVRPICGKGG